MRQASIGGTCNEKDLSLHMQHTLARKAELFERTLFFPLSVTQLSLQWLILTLFLSQKLFNFYTTIISFRNVFLRRETAPPPPQSPPWVLRESFLTTFCPIRSASIVNTVTNSIDPPNPRAALAPYICELCWGISHSQTLDKQITRK